MEFVCKAFVTEPIRSGYSIGVLPIEKKRNRDRVKLFIDLEKGRSYPNFHLKPGYPNPFVEMEIRTPLPSFDANRPDRLTRNFINVLTPQLIIGLPGGDGTRNEIELAREFANRAALDSAPKLLLIGWKDTGGKLLRSSESVTTDLPAAVKEIRDLAEKSGSILA